MKTDLTSITYLYHLAGDRTAYEVGKYVISEGFIPHVVRPPRFMGYDDRGRRLLAHWVLIRNSTKLLLTPASYSGTLGRRRRRRKTSHTRTQQQAATE